MMPKKIGALTFYPFSSTSTEFWCVWIREVKKAKLRLFSFALWLRFTATGIACGRDSQIDRPHSKDVLSPVCISLVLLVYSSSVLLKGSCCESH